MSHIIHHRTAEKADGKAEFTDCGLKTADVESTQDWTAVDCGDCERHPEDGVRLETSIHLDLPAAKYHADPRLGSGTLRRAYTQSLAHVRWNLDRQKSGDVEPDSERQGFGHLFHTAVLESARFAAEHRPAVERGKGFKAANLKLQAAGHKLIKRADLQTIWGMMGSIASNPLAQRIVTESEHEVTVFAGDCKARIDMWLAGERTICDLKYTRDASPSEFARSIATYGYHAQGAHYLDVANAAGLQAERFLFLCVEARPPYAIGIYELDPESIEIGRRQNARALDKIRDALVLDAWPDYSPGRDEPIPRISVPFWYASRHADEMAGGI